MTTPADALEKLAGEGLLRQLRPLESGTGPQVARGGRDLWNFAANDYLGLTRHPEVEDAFIRGIRRYGAGSGASRLVCGSLPPHRLLEETLAQAKSTEAALTFSSGFATALGIIPAVVGKADFVLLDKLSHACLVDGARHSGATLRVFPHNDLEKLHRLLVTVRADSPTARILIVTESVFSMDGDLAPLTEITDLAEAFNALLLVDEAHAIGVLGPTGMGLAEELGLQHRITFQMGTFSKALGLSGGYVATSRDWVDLFINSSRPLIFSTAPPPAIAHAALTSLEIVRSPEGDALRAKLQENLAELRPDAPPRTPIVPVVLGGNEAALEASATLEQAGFLVPAIRFPTVPRGTARLRISLSAAHPREVVARLVAAISSLPNRPATR
jgi:8-amino-7-oxononanoate synthase